MKKFNLFFVALLCTTLNGLAQITCPGTPTYLINTTAKAAVSAYTIANNESLAITSGITYSGNISFTGTNATICITGNSKFTGTINNVPSGAQVYVESGSTFAPSGSYYTTAGYFLNYGTLTFPNTLNSVNGTFKIDNYSTASFASGVQPSASITSTFNNYSGATITFVYYNNSNTTSDVVNITNAGTFTASGTFGFGNNSTITNSGTATFNDQFNFQGTGCTLTNSGNFYANGYSSFYSNSSISNSGYTYISNLTLSGNSTMTNTSSGVLSFGNKLISLPDGTTSSITNNGTINFQIGLQLGTGTTLTNNNDIQMDNSNSTLVNNGNCNNYGYVYINGSFTSNSSSNTNNYCTIVATTGMSLQGSSNNSGYMLIPTNGTIANGGSPLFLVNGGTFTNNGWVQGTNFKNNSTVNGSGSFYFSGNTDVENTFKGTSSSSPLNFYDASYTPTTTGSSGYSYFDQGWGTVSNTVRTAISPVSINSRASTCSAAVLAAGSNSECSSKGTGYLTSGTNLLLNGSFTSPVTTSVISTSPGTYNSGAATAYSFSGGSFKSQSDYNGTSCAKAYSNGNAFAIVSATPTTPYTGSGNCSNNNQKYFPGDATYGIAAADTMMAITGNYTSGSEYLGYQQTVTGLTVNNYYTFYFYITNLREPSNTNTTDEPYIRVRVGGTDGRPDGTLGFGPYTFDETTTQNSAALNGWVRVAYTFKATSTTTYLKITDGAYKSSNGDDWAITALGLQLCGNCTPTIAPTCSTTPPKPYVQLNESSGMGVTWYWTTTSGGRFYTSSDYSVETDSTTSHLESPYIRIYGDYTLQITTSTGCVGTGTITISSSCGTALAFSLSSFTAQQQGGNAVLKWNTVTETNNRYFDIEHSTDGVKWTSLGTVAGAGTTTTPHAYGYVDHSPVNGLNYYRLKQVDYDGNYHYSDIRTLLFSSLQSLRIYPNPVNDQLVVILESSKDETSQLSITDAAGRKILIQAQYLTNGSNTITINGLDRIAPGLYLVNITTSTKRHVTKFIKAGK